MNHLFYRIIHPNVVENIFYKHQPLGNVEGQSKDDENEMVHPAWNMNVCTFQKSSKNKTKQICCNLTFLYVEFFRHFYYFAHLILSPQTRLE